MKRRQARFGWGLTPWLAGLALCVGCTHVDHHGKCPPAGDCVGYPSGLCAGYYPTCWRMWPAECPSCPVEPAPVAVPGPGVPAATPSDSIPEYLVPEDAAPPPAAAPQTPSPAIPQLPPTPRAAGRRPQPIRSRPVPRVEDSTSVGPPPRPMAAATVRAEARPDLASVMADLPAVRVVSEVRPLPPVQDAPAVRQANRIRVAPVEWGQLIAELPSARMAAPRPPQPAAPIAPVVVPTGPAVRPPQRQAAPPGSVPEPAVRAAQPIRR